MKDVEINDKQHSNNMNFGGDNDEVPKMTATPLHFTSIHIHSFFLSFHDNKNDDDANSNNNDRNKRQKINNNNGSDDDNDNNQSNNNNASDDLRLNRDQMVIPNVTVHTSKTAPWMTLKCLPPLKRPNQAHMIPPLLKLHNEIVGFSKLISPQDFEIQLREKLAENIKQVAHDIFGGSESVSHQLAFMLYINYNSFHLFIN